MKKMLHISQLTVATFVLLTAFAAQAADTSAQEAQLAVIKRHRDSQELKLASAAKFPGLANTIQTSIDSDDRKIQVLEAQIARAKGIVSGPVATPVAAEEPASAPEPAENTDDIVE